MTDPALTEILPNTANGLHGTGFLFGAGTSVEAGYPMMPELTRQVIAALTGSERELLNQALRSAGEVYDGSAGEPNIEHIADAVISHGINSGLSAFSALEQRLRRLVVDCILSVKIATLDHHVRFLEYLKARTYGKACCVYIFTTNYDVLFELAAAQAGVSVETGFTGSIERFFDQDKFTTACGRSSGNRFNPHPVLTVRLIKLHGSISWTSQNAEVFEKHPNAVAADASRVMILPRRRKILETLYHPYDTLFAVSSRIIGTDCKYIASCGFSFGDEHINSTLIQPGLAASKLRLFTFCQCQPDGISSFQHLPAFNAGFENTGISAGKPHDRPTRLWRFSEFVGLFN